MHQGGLITTAVLVGAVLAGIGLASLLSGGSADTVDGLPAAKVDLERFKPPTVAGTRVPALRTTSRRAASDSEPTSSSTSPQTPAQSQTPAQPQAPAQPQTPAQPQAPKPAPDVIGETEGGSG